MSIRTSGSLGCWARRASSAAISPGVAAWAWSAGAVIAVRARSADSRWIILIHRSPAEDRAPRYEQTACREMSGAATCDPGHRPRDALDSRAGRVGITAAW